MSTATADVSKRQAWVMAARPQTLPAGAAPVIVGMGLAVHAGVFALLPAVAALVGALLIQIGTNFANDYYDAVKGADTDEREGFTRVTAGGLIDADEVKRAMIATYGLAVVIGIYLVAVGGLPIVVVGLSGIAAGILYTGGPFPYGYRGLGDLFVFVYFGVIAVTGTYYVQAVASASGVGTFPMTLPPGSVTAAAITASLPAAGLSTAILVVNNIRDRETDRAAGKKTLAVYMGYRWSRVEFLLLVGMAYAVPVVFALDGQYGLPALAPLLTLPLAATISKTVLTQTGGDALNPTLERVGQTLFAHSVLFALGLAIPQLL
ncbi:MULTISPECIES: 1,4-dihydroxy-2-naphthoate polyprenyltransferase [unclassified Haloarcula]|uniref:1,4-dihydroxy-2-naphthoate polyprenyltransferase n=1 Tax=unclassified Haloarcula TaxID=2624677 RepID=UPI000EF13129|nr:MULTISPECIES: 1,4-dihydroxy-2-naphthoate polyprenyltransferase [unclassified Haloarcula]RLM42416.1 1,4-dihydroxy-2-naphthoate polyprenyltransferase [Haloarcula sp. Atlit-47R]RLM95397.1 1,4-dihydroxy-2-naphthoate polyprenyltransferase [Haloarcula sp. Atlit-7R]